MINAQFHFHTDRETHKEQIAVADLPRVGDTIAYGKYLRDQRAYQVTQVLWHMNKDGIQKVIVTAAEDTTTATMRRINAG